MDENNTKTNEKSKDSSEATKNDTTPDKGKDAPVNRQYKSTVIHKLLIGATLSTAFVSFIATAQGMEMYIFQGNLLFALVISAAVQGSLYTLSISGIPLLHSRKLKRFGKVMACILWALLLFTSSIFSFVYISKTAYPDRVMHSDAEQNMNVFLHETSYELLGYTDKLIDSELETIIDYTESLNGGLSYGFEVNQDDKEMFDNYINKLKTSEKAHAGADIAEHYNTESIRSYLEKLETGRFTTADMDACIDQLIRKRDNLGEAIEYYKNEIKTLNVNIENLDARLETFSNDTMEEYKILFKQRMRDLETRKEYDQIKKELNDFKPVIDNCLTFVSETFDKGVENELSRLTKSLYKEINKDNIDTVKVLDISEGIYNMLLEGNDSGNMEEALSGYTRFKQSMSNYRSLVDSKLLLKEEIAILGDYSYQMLTNKTNESEGVSEPPENTESVNPSGSFGNESALSGTIVDHSSLSAAPDESVTSKTNVLEDVSEPQKNIESVDSSGSLGNESTLSGTIADQSSQTVLPKETSTSKAEDEQWTIFWSERLANMLTVIQDLPDENNSGIIIDKSRILRGVLDRRRLYLVQLNDFDRALTLAIESFFGFHEHGLMVKVSLVSAFALDLFSMATGILLFFFKSRR